MNKHESLIPEDDGVNAREEIQQLIEDIRNATTVQRRIDRTEILIATLPDLCLRGRLDLNLWKTLILKELAP